ncbi:MULTISPECIES: YqgE/AlgH family protein [unclassified Nitrosomonas]|jgi:putative transcriptional regulator|uniref:YqgE/AlgH family protein n=1 Tax=unclassified Nitrosomonas TaxID=2609265 RepID=UPI001DEB7672|nr:MULTISPECIES: YqgE/AlgH family protein [unclassified Nitrosomonas]MBX9895473.1 YqgE/AlgH family protein [Nitrosomonas sp.]WMJ08409.1 YqgE/AlgH family protein [Nitrosomonas sp. sh817]
MKNVNLTHHFLIAMPTMVDTVFSKTLTYICEHNEQGALGLVINRPTDLTLMNLFKQLGIPQTVSEAEAIPVLFGGPVQLDCGFVLHHPIGNWQSTLVVNKEVGLTTSLDILKAIANAEGPDQILIAMGYAGWAAGQIEHELAQNAWLTVPATADVLFGLPSEERLPAAMQLLGIQDANISNEVGHA